MYTQCPECLTAFRVTAALLQQASGRVRCGGCGQAFSALERLSEEPPPAEEANGDKDADSLLDTFTDLSAFDDVRIEDTGVEWRVVDDEGDFDQAPDNLPGNADQEVAETTVRWFLSDEERKEPAAGEASLPEVRDAVPAADRPEADSGDGVILIEETPAYRPQASLDLARPDPDEQRYDDDTPLPEHFGELDVTAVAGREIPRRRATDYVEPRSAEFDERQVDFELGDPENWRELLDELESEGEPAQTGTVDFELEADVDGASAVVDFDPGATGSHELDFDIRGDGETGFESVDFDPGEERPAGTGAFELADAFEAAAGACDEEAAGFDDARDAASANSGEPRPADDAEGSHEVPPQTEAEITINMQIDQDLMRLAAQEGLGSRQADERRIPQESLLVETIVMEGDVVKSALGQEPDEVLVGPAGSAHEHPPLLPDTRVKGKDERVRGGRRWTDPPNPAVIAGVVVLGVMLLAQVVHAYRESLATSDAFGHIVGSVYRLLGAPLVPEWNVRGWRFEETAGSTDAADEVLTIRSRLSNRGAGALPYPLLHVTLTDRFEEVLGSRVVEPFEYLTDGEDPATPAAPGEAFRATITVNAVSSDATGFKLNVCYREDAVRLRCATEAFRE